MPFSREQVLKINRLGSLQAKEGLFSLAVEESLNSPGARALKKEHRPAIDHLIGFLALSSELKKLDALNAQKIKTEVKLKLEALAKEHRRLGCGGELSDFTQVRGLEAAQKLLHDYEPHISEMIYDKIGPNEAEKFFLRTAKNMRHLNAIVAEHESP